MVRRCARPPRFSAAAWGCVLALAWACGPREHGEEHAHGADEAQAPPHPRGAPAPDVLVVDPSLLRDLHLTVRAAELRAAGEAIHALGDLRVDEERYAEVGSPIAARVMRVLAAPGDTVTAGQPLAELSSVSIGETRALSSTTRARLTLAQQRIARLKELAKHQIVPDQELRAAEAELAEAEAQQASAQHALGALGGGRGTGASLMLVSPLAGTVIDRDAVRGRLVDAEHRLFAVGDLTRLWLVVHAFERDAVRVRTGVRARVTLAALPGQVFEGEVTHVASRVDPASRTLAVRIELDNPENMLRPGMSASAAIPIGDAATQTLSVPLAAVQRVRERWCVFLPEAQPGHFRIRDVGRGRDLGGQVEILQGLQAGERVVVDGAFLLKAEADKRRAGGGDHHH